MKADRLPSCFGTTRAHRPISSRPIVGGVVTRGPIPFGHQSRRDTLSQTAADGGARFKGTIAGPDGNTMPQGSKFPGPPSTYSFSASDLSIAWPPKGQQRSMRPPSTSDYFARIPQMRIRRSPTSTSGSVTRDDGTEAVGRGDRDGFPGDLQRLLAGFVDYRAGASARLVVSIIGSCAGAE